MHRTGRIALVAAMDRNRLIGRGGGLPWRLPADLARRLPCPGCDDPMHVHPYYGPGDFVIDSCTACRYV